MLPDQKCSEILFNCYRYSLVTAEEWSRLMQFYEADYPIIIKKTGDDYQVNPGEYKFSCSTGDKRLLGLFSGLFAITASDDFSRDAFKYHDIPLHRFTFFRLAVLYC